MMWKTSRTASGTMPGSRGVPRIVYVLPLLVWPYAKTVALKPETSEWMRPCVVTL